MSAFQVFVASVLVTGIAALFADIIAGREAAWSVVAGCAVMAVFLWVVDR